MKRCTAKIALIDYNMGNLFSVCRAFEYVGGNIELVSNPDKLAAFDSVVLPGVGNFGDGMAHLNVNNMSEAVKLFAQSGKPLFGICLGMQMLLESSEEAPGVAGLGLIKGSVRRFVAGSGEKIPQIGWNSVNYMEQSSPIFSGVPDGSFFYFVHSYYAEVENPAEVIGETEYIRRYASAVGSGNIFGMQFHPEKSQNCGLGIIENFVRFGTGY